MLDPTFRKSFRRAAALSVATGAALFGAAALTPAAAFYHSEPEPSGATQGGQMASADVAAVIDMTSSLDFEPANVTVTAGQTVEWRNVSSFPHTVTADPSRAANPANVSLPDGAQTFNASVSGGESFRFTFEVPGTYRYVCLPHEASGMTATIEVRPAA